MSNFLAIATVTATLSRVLQAAVSADVPGATVSTVRPECREWHSYHRGEPLPVPGRPCASLRNADLPTRRSDGQLVQRPQGGSGPPLPADLLRQRGATGTAASVGQCGAHLARAARADAPADSANHRG